MLLHAMNLMPQEPASDEIQAFLAQTLEQCVDAVIVTDHRQQIQLFNKAAEQLWACHRHEVLGAALETLLCPAANPAHLPHVASEQPWVGSNRDAVVMRLDGSHLPASASISRIVLERRVFYTVFIRDTSEQQRQQERLQQLPLLADKSDSAVFLSSRDRVSLETALRNALHLEQLELEYQPQISGDAFPHLYGVEALLRWHDPDLGTVPPSRFVAVAEECGLISELSLWVLRKACAQLADWRWRGVDVPRVSVNVSAINFRDRELARQIAEILDEHSLVPDDLTLEITESVMLDPDPDVLENIEAIYVTGVRLSLDDFGTGYSSLSHLHRLPIYELKLDQSFVRDIDTSAIARTLTTSVLRIGESLHMKVVAEGVETAAQHRFLTENGFPILQGYLFSEPLAAAELEQWLENNDFIAGKVLETVAVG